MLEIIPITYLQILLAFALGLILGLQREYSEKPAGLRTYSLVATGAALFTIISINGFNQFLVDASRYDPSRIASNIVTGIGFLGAGVIIFRDKRVEGLTTAAGLWVAAGLGMAVGAEMYGLAIFTTVISYTILDVMGRPRVEEWLRIRRTKAESNE